MRRLTHAIIAVLLLLLIMGPSAYADFYVRATPGDYILSFGCWVLIIMVIKLVLRKWDLW